MAASLNEVASTDGKPRTFSCEKHSKKILSALNENRKIANFCDGVVIIGDANIPVQKNVLAAASHYFRLVFNYEHPTNAQVADQKSSTVDISSLGISEEVFHTIINYIYTSKIPLCEENVQDILQAADLLLLDDLKLLCCEYLEQCITSQNCLGIWEFASHFTCPWIHLKTSLYIDENFREISQSEEFLRLPAETLCHLLSRDTLSIKSEEDILRCIIKWFKADEMNRLSSLPSLIIECVRANQISDSFITTLIEVEPALSKCNILEIIQENRSRKANEKCRGITEVMVVVGGEGFSSNKTDELEIKCSVRCIIPNKQDGNTIGVWLDLPPMSTSRIGHGAVSIGGILYVVGGRNENCRILNSGEKYDPKTNKWSPLPPMEHARVGFGLVAVDDNIYALGGSNDMTDPLTSVEVYNLFSNKWKPAPDMNLKRVWSTYTVVNKKIYVIAGGAVGKLFESVECFDTRTETWTSLAPLKERRCDARAVTVDNDIYVFGGFRRIECPSAMHGGHNVKFCGTEVYSTRNDHWAQVHTRGFGLCTQTDASQIYGTVYDGDEILVVGDLDVGDRFHCARAFSLHTNTWRCVIQNAPPKQRGYAVCMLQMPLHQLISIKFDLGKLSYSDLRKSKN